MSDGVLTWNKTEILGEGKYGVVYKGLLNQIEVAVKVIDIRENEDAEIVTEREANALEKLHHPNILKLLYFESDKYFRHFALDLCLGTIEDYFTNQYDGPVPSSENALMQMTKGLAHIHENQFVHRDLSSRNVLIAKDVNNTYILKISDFGFCKPSTENGSHSMNSKVKGTLNYISPECFKWVNNHENADPAFWAKIRGTYKSDIFALGCIFYQYVTKGLHPFFDGLAAPTIISFNIMCGKHDLDKRPDLFNSQHFAYDAIKGMIENDPEKRWTLDEVEKSLLSKLTS